MVEEVRPRARRRSSASCSRLAGLGRAAAAATASGGRAARALAELDFDDPINIQYTSGTTGFPKGATLSHHNILNNGFFVGEGCALHEHDRVCIPVPFYHCFGMVMGNLGCITHGAAMVVPEAGVRARRGARDRAGGALHGALRRADDVHRRAQRTRTSRRSTCRSLRTGIMAGSPCPIEVMKQVIERMHMEDVTICYGMTETSPVSTQTARRRLAREAHADRRARAPARRGQARSTRRPARTVAARRAGRAAAPAATR